MKKPRTTSEKTKTPTTDGPREFRRYNLVDDSANPCAWYLRDLPKVPQNGVRVFSTFSCGGGSCMGYKRAGCDVVAANDCDPQMADHYRRNLHPKHYFECPVGDLVARDKAGAWVVPLPAELDGIDILEGSPPCSSFSPAGDRESSWGKKRKFREGQVDQVLSDTFFQYLDLVARVRPKVSIAENVQGMLLGNAKGYVKAIFARYRELGYLPQLFLVNAVDCGVPQERRRVFFLAVRADHAAERALGAIRLDFRHRPVSCEDACSDVEELTEEEVADTHPYDLDHKWWHLTRPGENYASAIQRAGLPNAAWNWIRHPRRRPACTLISQQQCMRHWGTRRGLSIREFVRLGSFPDDYEFESMPIGKYMIGMSVPPKMTEAVARAVCAQWLGVPP